MKKIVELEFDIDKIWNMPETEFNKWINSLSAEEHYKYILFRHIMEQQEGYKINWNYEYGRIVPKRPLDIEDFENLRGSIIRKKEDKTRHYLILSISDGDDSIVLYNYAERHLVTIDRLMVCKYYELIAKTQDLDKALKLEK